MRLVSDDARGVTGQAIARTARLDGIAWIFAAHQLGAATAAWGAGFIRTSTGDYTAAFLAAGALTLVAAAAVLLIRSVHGMSPATAAVTA